MILPFGTPPMPSAASNANEPVGIASTFISGRSPRRMTVPLPKFFSIWEIAVSSAFFLSLSGASGFFFSTAIANSLPFLFFYSIPQRSPKIKHSFENISRVSFRLSCRDRTGHAPEILTEQHICKTRGLEQFSNACLLPVAKLKADGSAGTKRGVEIL